MDNSNSPAAGHIDLPRRCPDGGYCHHRCKDGECFRVATCAPLGGVYPDDKWPEETKPMADRFIARVNSTEDHSECGRSSDGEGPDQGDCAHRGTPLQSECAEAGCGFCRAAEEYAQFEMVRRFATVFATRMFLDMMDATARGAAFDWAKFPESCGRLAYANVFTAFEDGKTTCVMKQLAEVKAGDVAEYLVKAGDFAGFAISRADKDAALDEVDSVVADADATFEKRLRNVTERYATGEASTGAEDGTDISVRG